MEKAGKNEGETRKKYVPPKIEICSGLLPMVSGYGCSIGTESFYNRRKAV